MLNSTWRPFLRGLKKLGYGDTERRVIERLAEERLLDMVKEGYIQKLIEQRALLKGVDKPLPQSGGKLE